MSEVKRYRAGDFVPVASVAASDFDAQRLRADTAEAELKLIRDALGIDPRHHVGKTTAEGIKGLADAYVRAGETEHELRKDVRLWKDRTTSLTHKIVAAEQRIAGRDELIADVLKAFQLNAEGRGSCINPGITFIQPWAERVAALNQKSEGESHADDL